MQIIITHMQKAALGEDSPIHPQWFIRYDCNYPFETTKGMASHQICLQHSTTLFLEDRRNADKVDYFILATKILHRGKMIYLK